MKKVLIAIGALLMIAGCAVVDKAGMAASVNGTELSVNELSGYIDQMNTSAGELGLGIDPAEVNRGVINAFIVEYILNEMARKYGVSATDAEVAARIRQLEIEFGSREALLQGAAESLIAEDRLFESIRAGLNTSKLGSYLAPDENQEEQNDLLFIELIAYAQTFDIKVAPRFGTWDSQIMVLMESLSDVVLTQEYFDFIQNG
jgi:hypothetical protein